VSNSSNSNNRPSSDWTAEREAELRAHLASRTDLSPVERDLSDALDELSRQRAECTELLARFGVQAPAPWVRSAEALWERPVSEARDQDEDGVEYDECPDGHLLVTADGTWSWWRRSELVAEGQPGKVIAAMQQAEAATQQAQTPSAPVSAPTLG
jgi:hypothetical protein